MELETREYTAQAGRIIKAAQSGRLPEFAALANPQKREEWLNRQFEDQSRARQKQIYDWNEKHRPAKEQARRDMSLFRSLLDSKPLSAERADLTELVSQMALKNKLFQTIQKPTLSLVQAYMGGHPQFSAGLWTLVTGQTKKAER